MFWSVKYELNVCKFALVIHDEEIVIIKVGKIDNFDSLENLKECHKWIARMQVGNGGFSSFVSANAVSISLMKVGVGDHWQRWTSCSYKGRSWRDSHFCLGPSGRLQHNLITLYYKRASVITSLVEVLQCMKFKSFQYLHEWMRR